MKTYSLIEIVWEDSRSPNVGWQFTKEADMPDICKCKTVGYLIEKTKKKVVVAQNVGDLHSNQVQVNGLMTIPMRCVIHMKIVKLKKKVTG